MTKAPRAISTGWQRNPQISLEPKRILGLSRDQNMDNNKPGPLERETDDTEERERREGEGKLEE